MRRRSSSKVGGRPLGPPSDACGHIYTAVMDRPTKFADHRFLGDKRTLIVYDLDDEATPVDAVDELMSAERFLGFGPDTLAEARNRGYRPWKG